MSRYKPNETKTIFFISALVLISIAFSQESKVVAEVKSPHDIVAQLYDDESCYIQVQLNKEMSVIYKFGGVSEYSLKKFVNLINAEFYEEKGIDRKTLTDWMNSNVATAIKLKSDDGDIFANALGMFVSSTLRFELSELENNVYIYEIDTSLRKYLE